MGENNEVIKRIEALEQEIDRIHRVIEGIATVKGIDALVEKYSLPTNGGGNETQDNTGYDDVEPEETD